MKLEEFDKLLVLTAKKIPSGVRKVILEEGFISKARNIMEINTPMEYLFDVYAEFIDGSGEFDDWTCFKCREHILSDFIKMLPILELLKDAD